MNYRSNSIRLLALAGAMVVISLPNSAQGQCTGSELPTDFCNFARVIPGVPGEYDILMNLAGTTGSEILCGEATGLTVWFEVTPIANGLLTFSTCHPSTTYDTVVTAYAGGDDACDFMTIVDCNNETIAGECYNGCCFIGCYYASVVSFNATAGTRYRFGVGAVNANSVGCPLCLGVHVNVPGSFTNSWVAASSGMWQGAGNWSLDVAPSSTHFCYITNATSKTVTIDSTTTNFPTTLTITNLTVSAPLNSTNTLFLNNAGLMTPLRIRDTFTITTGGALRITNSFLRVDGLSFYLDGDGRLDTGAMIATNAVVSVGYQGRGTLTVSNGTVQSRAMDVGALSGSDGTFRLAGGTNICDTFMRVGASGTGTVWMTGGRLVVTNVAHYLRVGEMGVGRMTVSNGVIEANVIVGSETGSHGTLTLAGGMLVMTNTGAIIGDYGSGQMRVSNSTVLAHGMTVGLRPGSQGTYIVAGGTNVFNQFLTIGSFGESTGSVWMTGGQLLVTNNPSSVLFVGNGGHAQMTVSNGLLWANRMVVADEGDTCDFTVAGGTNVLGALDIATQGTGTVWLTGGRLVVTNAMDTIDIGNGDTGRLISSNGTLLAREVRVSYGFANREGTYRVAGGTNVISEQLSVGLVPGRTGEVWVTGGQLTLTNGFINLGTSGHGRLTVSNGVFRTSLLFVGAGAPGAQGTFTVAGGTNEVLANMYLGSEQGTPGTVWMSGGELSVTNPAGGVVIGVQTASRMTVSNGTFVTKLLRVGNFPFTSESTFISAGGITRVLGNFDCGYTGSGTVWVTGGQLVATNGPTTVGFADLGQMTVSNGIFLARDVQVGNPVISLGVFNAIGGTTTVLSNFTVTSGPAVIAGGNLAIGGSLILANAGGSFQFNSGTVSANGVDQANGQEFIVGNGGTGHLTLSNGTHQFASNLLLGNSLSSTGTLVVASGQLILTNNNNLRIGGGFISFPSTGLMIVSNGTVLAQNIYVGGQSTGANGTLTIAGGTVTASTTFTVADFSSTGTVWITGGRLVATNSFILANTGTARMTISNGTVLAQTLNIASSLFSFQGGALTAVGGTTTVSSSLTLGNSGCTASGIVTVAGGELDVTNATGNATLEIRSGSVTLNSGTLRVDTFFMTNSCANFIRTGGTLIYGTAVLAPNRDDDSDGIPNSYEQGHGFDPLNPNDAGNDNDGDGQSNLQEFIAGTSPTNSASVFAITSITRVSTNILITWQTAAGKTNALERTAGVAGSFTNDFTVLTNIVTTGTTTNYLDIGAATNVPAFYYRVRLVP